MDKLLITGGTPLRGRVQVSGAKNAALPLLAATLLTDETVQLHHMPQLADIRTMIRLLEYIGVEHGADHDFRARGIERAEAPYDIVKTMRASSLILGPLLARAGQAHVSLPGGCAIGARPLNLHLDALQAMGAHITIDEGYVLALASRLRGAEIHFPSVTVTGTENIMMAATLAEGTTVLHRAAREPEIVDLATCLRAMGADIHGAGTDTITIRGVSRLHGAQHRIMPDRIEAGTFLIAAVMTGGDLEVQGCIAAHVGALLDKLEAVGASLAITDEGIHIHGPQTLTSRDCTTEPFPGFATDLQAQWMAAMTLAQGTSRICETIFENRFMHVGELQRMGADITIEGHCAIVRGVAGLRGAPVMATDLRASACLVLAGLAAQGKTLVQRIYHLDRGYEGLEGKLRSLGASILRISE